MKHSISKNRKTYKGTGIVIGVAIAIVAGIVAYLLSGNVTIAISSAAVLGITMGISIDQKLKEPAGPKEERVRAILITLLFVGVLVFLGLLFLAKLT